MQTAKEKASNAAAIAKADVEKAKATLQEKVEKVKAHDAAEKAAAEQRKEDRVSEAETDKQLTKEDNAESRTTRRTGEKTSSVGLGANTVDRTPVVSERVISGNDVTGHQAEAGHGPVN